MPKRVDPPFDVKGLMQQGDQFLHAMHLFGQQTNDEFAKVATPFVVCSSFALEAYLKVLTYIEKNLRPLKTHNLRDLFFDISPESQVILEEKWTKEALPKIMRHHQNPYLPSDFPRIQTFRQALEQSAHAFVDWRYAGRKDDRNFSLPDLVPMAWQIIAEKRPEIRSRKQIMRPLDGPLPPLNQEDD